MPVAEPTLWNSRPHQLKPANSLMAFRRHLITQLIDLAYYTLGSATADASTQYRLVPLFRCAIQLSRRMTCSEELRHDLTIMFSHAVKH